MTVSEYLVTKGITAGELARRLGVPRVLPYRWARGAIPRGRRLQQLIDGTGGAVTLEAMLAASERRREEAVGE